MPAGVLRFRVPWQLAYGAVQCAMRNKVNLRYLFFYGPQLTVSIYDREHSLVPLLNELLHILRIVVFI
jgi:hypothetical protein